MDPDKDLVNSKPDPFFALMREVGEETGINGKQYISSVICLGLNDIDQPCLGFNTQLNYPTMNLFQIYQKKKSLESWKGMIMTSNLLNAL